MRAYPGSGTDREPEHIASRSPGLLRAVASLWFAAVLLVLLLVAMACATVFESIHGTEQALAVFYRSRWFAVLLALFGINVAAAVVVRFPFNKRQAGFVVTHISILLILVGSLVTQRIGIDGQVGIAEGQTVDRFTIPVPTLTAVSQADQTASTVDLTASVFDGFEAADAPRAPILSLGPLRAEILRYLPDSTVAEHVAEDERFGRPAVEVSIGPDGRGHSAWVFAGETQEVGPLTATLRTVADEAELAQLLQQATPVGQDARGVVRIAHQGTMFEIPLADCTDRAVPLGETGYAVRLLRYLPHATVGADRQLVNSSDRPINPAVELELMGPEGAFTRRAFARFPDFGMMHGGEQEQDFKVTFVAATDVSAAAPVEVLAGPGGRLHVRFRQEGQEVVNRELTVGQPIETPWSRLSFQVLQHLDRARMSRRIEPVDPVRKTRIPAVLVGVSTLERTSEVWVQKHVPRPVTVDGQAYELVFQDKEIPLGFNVTLNRFRIGSYPGERRPRSFESDITILDPASGRSQGRVVSMNRPVKHGGYSFYQSSYRQDGERMFSFLSVSRDPGQIVVFAGFIALMIGMVMVLITRATGRRPTGRRPTGGCAP